MFFEGYSNNQQEEFRTISQTANISQYYFFEFFLLPEFIIYKIPFFNPTYSKNVYKVNFSLAQIISRASCQFFCNDKMKISEYIMQYSINYNRDSYCSGTIPLVKDKYDSDYNEWIYHGERQIFLQKNRYDKREKNYPFEQYKFIFPENCLNKENEINKIYYSFNLTKSDSYSWRVDNGNNTGSVTFFIPKKKEVKFSKNWLRQSSFFTSNVVEGTSFLNANTSGKVVYSKPISFLQERLFFSEDLFSDKNMLWRGINFNRELIFNRKVSWRETKNFIRSYFLETSFDKHEREISVISQSKLFGFSLFPSLITFFPRENYNGDEEEIIFDRFNISPLIKTHYRYNLTTEKNEILQDKNWKWKECGIKLPLWENFMFTMKLDFNFKAFFDYKVSLVNDFIVKRIISEQTEINKKRYLIGKTNEKEKNFFVYYSNKYLLKKDDAIYFYQHNDLFLQENFSFFQDKFKKDL